MMSLAECCEIISGATPKTGVASYWDGDIDWVTPADLSDLEGPFIDETPRKITKAGLASCSATVLPVGAVLLSSRAPIGHVAIALRPMATNQGFKSLVPRAELVDPKYLYHWLRTNKSHLQSLGNGATFKELSKAAVARIEIPVPSLGEQRRIAAILDQAEVLLLKRRQALGHLDDLTQSIFHARFDDPAQARVPLGSVCLRITDGTHQPPKWAAQGHPFLFVSNIVQGEIDFHTSRFISDETHAQLTARCPIDRGDVLYSTVGTYGVPVVVRTDAKFAFQRHIAHLKPNRELIHPDFLAVQLASSDLKRQADSAARGVAQKTVNLKDIRDFSVIVPAMQEQARFVSELESIRSIDRRMRAAQAVEEELGLALRHAAFSSSG